MDFLKSLQAGSVQRKVITFSKDPLLQKAANHLKSKHFKVVGFHEFPSDVPGGEILFTAPDRNKSCFEPVDLVSISQLIEYPHRVLRLSKEEEFKLATVSLGLHLSKPVLILRFY